MPVSSEINPTAKVRLPHPSSLMAATPLIPRARPRSLAGKASVTIALELAKRKAPPTPWNNRMMISHSALTTSTAVTSRKPIRSHRK